MEIFTCGSFLNYLNFKENLTKRFETDFGLFLYREEPTQKSGCTNILSREVLPIRLLS